MTTTTTQPELTALDMARNCVAAVQAAAAWQADDDPERQILAHVHHVGAQGDQASKVAARMAQVSIAEDLRRIAGHLTAPPGPEKITRGEGDDDWLYCLCGNNPSMGGFGSCLPDGTPVEPVGGSGPGAWDGRLYVCYVCGRIVDQDTLEVTGRRGEPYIRALEARIADLENQDHRLTPDDTAGWSPTG
jgi:hypothetical protein